MHDSIHDGYRITGGLPALAAFRRAFACEGRALGLRLLAGRMASIAAGVMDRAAAGLHPPCPAPEGGDTPYAYAYARLRRAHEGARQRAELHPLDDVDCAVVALPRGRDVLLAAYAARPEYQGLISGLPGVEPYSYWPCDVADRPAGVTAAAWAARGRAWASVLGEGNRAPGRNGFTFDLLGPYLPQMDPVEVAAAMPSLEQRVKALRRTLAYVRWLERHKGMGPREQAAPVGWPEGARLALDFADHCETPEGQDLLGEAADDLRARLPASLSADDLLAEVVSARVQGPT